MPQQPSFFKIVSGRPVLDVGSLRHPITIEQKALASPPAFDDGGPVGSWEPVVSALAAIDAVRGTDVIKGGQTTTQLFLTVVLWWQAGIAPEMRVVTEGGNKFLIQAVENVLEMNVVLVLNCIGLGAND